MARSSECTPYAQKGLDTAGILRDACLRLSVAGMWFAEEIVRCYDESAFFRRDGSPIRNAKEPVQWNPTKA